jgi:hypothetical protein
MKNRVCPSKPEFFAQALTNPLASCSYTQQTGVFGCPGRVVSGGGRREYLPVGLATASLLSTPPPAPTRPSRAMPARGQR